jgi:hypothetical protein
MHPQKIAAVDAIPCRLRRGLVFLQYFVFFKPIHFKLHLVFDCLHSTKLARRAFIPAAGKSPGNNSQTA